MARRWPIALYVDASGCPPVSDYLLDEKNQKDFGVIFAVIQRLSRTGLDLVDTNMAKRIDSLLYELRKDRHRIIFAEDSSKGWFVLLSAFLKKTEKTPPEEIEKAHRYWVDYQRTGNFLPLKFVVEEP